VIVAGLVDEDVPVAGDNHVTRAELAHELSDDGRSLTQSFLYEVEALEQGTRDLFSHRAEPGGVEESVPIPSAGEAEPALLGDDHVHSAQHVGHVG